MCFGRPAGDAEAGPKWKSPASLPYRRGRENQKILGKSAGANPLSGIADHDPQRIAVFECRHLDSAPRDSLVGAELYPGGVGQTQSTLATSE